MVDGIFRTGLGVKCRHGCGACSVICRLQFQNYGSELKLFRAIYVIVVYKSISGMDNVTFLQVKGTGDYAVNVWYCRIYTSQW